MKALVQNLVKTGFDILKDIPVTLTFRGKVQSDVGSEPTLTNTTITLVQCVVGRGGAYDQHRANLNAKVGDLFVVCPSKGNATIPSGGMRVRYNGKTYTMQEESNIDPATASYVFLLRGT